LPRSLKNAIIKAEGSSYMEKEKPVLHPHSKLFIIGVLLLLGCFILLLSVRNYVETM
jgi:hypothetical protein